MGERALLVIDIQNDYFPGGRWPLVGADAAAANAVRVIEAARAAGDLVVFVQHVFEGAEPPFFAADTKGVELHESLAPRPDEPLVVKHEVNAFKGTDLAQLLKDRGVGELTIVGSMSHVCIDSATRAAADQGYAVTVVHDACATHDVEFQGAKVPAAQVHAAFMSGLGFGFAILRSTDEQVGGTAKAA